MAVILAEIGRIVQCRSASAGPDLIGALRSGLADDFENEIRVVERL
jgi:hypothetical protein